MSGINLEFGAKTCYPNFIPGRGPAELLGGRLVGAFSSFNEGESEDNREQAMMGGGRIQSTI